MVTVKYLTFHQRSQLKYQTRKEIRVKIEIELTIITDINRYLEDTKELTDALQKNSV